MPTVTSSGGFKPSTTDTPLDVRTRVNTYAKIRDIQNPYIGMEITVLSDETNNNEKTKYEINGNSNLENGSVITIDVKAEDESSITYKINIIKEVEIVPKKSGVGKVITTIIILILLGVIGVVAFKFIRNILPAKADENYDYE